MMKLAVIVGSTRPNRQTLKQAKWVAKSAQEIEGIDAQILDLEEFPMPFFNEPMSPRYNPERQIAPEVQKWIDALASFDAYVFVTPEYNHSITGVLKNALDFVTSELNRKPSAIVSHGTVGGARAAMMLKEILSESRSVVIPQAVAFVSMSGSIDDEGSLKEELRNADYGPQTALNGMLNELKWYSDALSEARAKS